MGTRFSFVAASLVVFATRFSRADFSLNTAAERLLKYPYRACMPPSSKPWIFSTFCVVSRWAAEFSAPKLTVPSLACALMRALECAFL